MIIGIGCDLVDSRRIEALWKRQGERFLNRIFTDLEQARAFKRVESFLGFSKIFAAKEAAIKALGGMSGIRWHDLEVQKDPLGKPILHISGIPGSVLAERFPGRLIQTHLTISDEPPYAQGFVIIEAL